MNLPNETFCVLPWISLEASPIGTVRPCCLADGEVADEEGRKYHVREDSLTHIQGSKWMDSLRQAFLKGQKPEICRRCWSVEDSGGTSKRLHTLDRLKDILADETTWTVDPKPLMFLDLKLGNICNIACRICGSWSSSTYAGEELKQLSYEKRKESFARVMIKEGAWPRESDRFWKELDFHAEDIRYLEFTGGEPFMIKEHFEFLQKLVNRDLARNIEIHYNTNGTLYPEEWVHLWREFKHVEIAFSMDDVNERFEYQRAGASWREVNQNIYKFIELKNASNGTISLQICTTINIFNVLYLEDIAKWNANIKHEMDFIYWNMLHDAPVHCITALPASAKEVIERVLNEADVIPEFRKEFERIIKFMRSPSKVTLEELQTNINILDARKGTSLLEVEPKLWELVFNV